MMTSEQHCTTEQINAFIDGTLPADGRQMVESHIAECVGCNQAFFTMGRIDASLKNPSLERVSTDFTRQVLSALHLAPKSPLMFRLLEKGAYVFGMFIVLGVMLTVFVATGVVDSREASRTETIASQIFSDAGGMMLAMMSGLSEVLAQYLPFIFGNGNLSIVAAAGVVLGVLALADRMLGRRLIRRVR